MIVDANVLVSAVFGGIPRDALLRALCEEVYISGDIERELSTLQERLRRKLHPDDLGYWTHTFLPSILQRTRRARVSRRIVLCRDPKDDAYLSLALSVSADYLVTGDKDLLLINPRRLIGVGLDSLKIVSPRRFLEGLD